MREILELIHRDRGPEGHAELTLELSSHYVRAFYEELKESLPRHAWHYEPESQRWFIEPMFKRVAERLGDEHFDSVCIQERLF